MTDLSEKTALVTGSVQGIGFAVARALAEAGARVAVHGLAGDAEIHDVCEALKAAGAPEAEFFHGDLRDGQQAEELMAAVTAWGGADILVNNAGIQRTGPIAGMPRADWDAILAVNLSAPFLTMKAALPIMAERGYGRVLNIASVERKGTLCGGQARAGRIVPCRGPGIRRAGRPGAGRCHRQLHLPGLDGDGHHRAADRRPGRGAW